MAQKKLAFLFIIILFFNSCSSRSVVKTEPAAAKVPEPVETPQQMLETIKMKKGSIITDQEAAAIQKLSEWLGREHIFQDGIATWYGRRFHGKRTANGEKYDMYKLTAAHKTLPFHTLVEVENLQNKKRVIVRINDRGPFLKNRIIDLSYNAAKKLDCCKDGVVPVALRIVTADTVTGPEMAAIDENPGQKTETPEKKVKEVMTKKVETKETGKPAIAPTESPQAKFYLQAGAFSEKENAQKMLNNMKTILAHVSFDIYFQNGMYKVISSPQPTRAKAEELKKTLKAADVDAFIKETI